MAEILTPEVDLFFISQVVFLTVSVDDNYDDDDDDDDNDDDDDVSQENSKAQIFSFTKQVAGG